MSLAYATKDQMKVWKSALRPEKDGNTERPVANVLLCIKKVEMGYIAYLVGTDGYQLVKRQIEVETGAKEVRIGIPREAVEQAEKAMKQGDRAYFDDDQRIIVREITIDGDIGFENSKIKAIIPYSVQLDLFPDYEAAIERAARPDLPARIVTLDASILKKVAEQLRSNDVRVNVDIHLREGLRGVVLKAFDGVEGEEITAVIMPIKMDD